MSLREGMRGRGVLPLGECRGFPPETRPRAVRGGVGGKFLARVAEVVRTDACTCTGLVRGYLAGAIDTICDY